MKSIKDLSIGKKLIPAVLAVSILGIIVLVVMIYQRTSSIQTKSAIENSKNLAKRYAKNVQAQLEVPMDAARTLAQVMESFETLNPTIRRDYYNSILKGLLESNPDFIAVWSCWESNALVGLDEQFAGTKGAHQ